MKNVDKGELIVPGLMGAFILAYHFQVRTVPSEVLLWPYIVTAALVVMLSVVLYQVLKKQGQTRKKTALKKPAALLLLTAGYLVSMKFIGYTVSSFLFLLGTMVYLGAGRKMAFIVSVSIAAILHVVMISFMDLTLPRLVMSMFTF
jgi:hypothetical protein